MISNSPAQVQLWLVRVLLLLLEKLREATYTAAVCKFRGGIFFGFGLVPSVAQLSLYSYFILCLPAAAFVHLDACWGPYCIVEVNNFWFGYAQGS